MYNNCSTEAKQIELFSEDHIMRDFFRKTLIDAYILINDQYNENRNSFQSKKLKTKQFIVMLYTNINVIIKSDILKCLKCNFK